MFYKWFYKTFLINKPSIIIITDTWYLTKRNSVPTTKRQGNLYFINNVGNAQVNSTRTAEEWHKVLGHCNIKDVKKFEKVVQGIHISGAKENVNCETCTLGKISKFRNREPDARAVKNLDLVHK